MVEGLESVRQGQAFDKQEIRDEIKEVRTLVELTYTDLDGRARVLEQL